MLNLPRNKLFQCCKLKKNLLQKVELGSTLRNILLQLATLKFVAWQVEHAVVIRETFRSTCNATMLRDKLNENVARITWTLRVITATTTTTTNKTTRQFQHACGL